jgi:hypothetical protein
MNFSDSYPLLEQRFRTRSPEHPATPQLFAAVAARQQRIVDDVLVSPPRLGPVLLHAAMTHPMGSRAEIDTAIASMTVSPAGVCTRYDPTSTVTRSIFDDFSRRCAKAVFDKNAAVAICGMKAFSALLKRIPLAAPASENSAAKTPSAPAAKTGFNNSTGFKSFAGSANFAAPGQAPSAVASNQPADFKSAFDPPAAASHLNQNTGASTGQWNQQQQQPSPATSAGKGFKSALGPPVGSQNTTAPSAPGWAGSGKSGSASAFQSASGNSGNAAAPQGGTGGWGQRASAAGQPPAAWGASASNNVSNASAIPTPNQNTGASTGQWNQQQQQPPATSAGKGFTSAFGPPVGPQNTTAGTVHSTVQLVDVTMLVSRYLTTSNDMPNSTLQHTAVELLTTIFARTPRDRDTTMCRCLPELLHVAMHDQTKPAVRRACFTALSTAGQAIDSCRAWLEQEDIFAQLVRLMDSQSCDTAARADAIGVLLRLSYCSGPHVPLPRYLTLFTERLRPSEDAMGTTAALWGLFLQLPTKEPNSRGSGNQKPLAVEACMAQLGLMHSVLEGDNTCWVEPILRIFQRLLELAPYDTKRLVEPVAVAARIIAFTQHPHEGLRCAAILTVSEFTRCHGLRDELVSDLFVALRGCLVAVPAVIPAGGDAARSDSEDLVREAVGRVHSAAGAFTTEQCIISKRTAFLTAVAFLPADTKRGRCAVDSGLFPALLQYRPDSAEDMAKRGVCMVAFVRGIDAAVDTVDEATWASFLAYIAESEGEIVLRAKLAMAIINVTHGARLWDVIIALRKAARTMKTTVYLRCPSDCLDVVLQLLAIDSAAPPHVIVATLDLLPKLLETNGTLQAGMAAQYATRLLRHTDRTIRDAVLRITPVLMRNHIAFRRRAVNLGLLDLISEDPANKETGIRDKAVRCLAQLCSNREDYSAALLTPPALALLATTAVRSGPDRLSADAVASEAFAALCVIHATESDRDACATLKPRETYLALVELAAIVCTASDNRLTSANALLLCDSALKHGVPDAAQIVLLIIAKHSGKLPFAVNGDMLLRVARYCYSDYERVQTAALGALATATANTTNCTPPHLRSLFAALATTFQRRVAREELRDVLRCAQNLLVPADATPLAVGTGLFRRLCKLYCDEAADNFSTEASFDTANEQALVACIHTCMRHDSALLLLDAGCAGVIIHCVTRDGTTSGDICGIVETVAKSGEAARALFASAGNDMLATLVQAVVRALAAQSPTCTGISPAHRIIALLKCPVSEVAVAAWSALGDSLHQTHVSRGACGLCPRDLAAAVAITDDLFSASTCTRPDTLPAVLQLIRTVMKASNVLPPSEGTEALWKRLLAHECVAIRVEVLNAVVKHKAQPFAVPCSCSDVVIQQYADAAITRLCAEAGDDPDDQTQHEVRLAITCLSQTFGSALMLWMPQLLTRPALTKALRITALQYVHCRWLSNEQWSPQDRAKETWARTAAAIALLARPRAEKCQEGEEVAETALQCIIAALSFSVAEMKGHRATTFLRLLLEAHCASALATRSTDPTARTVAAELERQAAITKPGAEAELHAAVKTLLRCGVRVEHGL